MPRAIIAAGILGMVLALLVTGPAGTAALESSFASPPAERGVLPAIASPSQPGAAATPAGPDTARPEDGARAGADRPQPRYAGRGSAGWRPASGEFAPAPGPQITAKAAFAVDLTAGIELFADNADAPLPPASLTKIVTALVAIRTVALDDVVTVEPDDLVDPTVYSHMGLEAGDQVTVHGLLAGMLLPSGDEAARALARYAGMRLGGGVDPRATFVVAMNGLAADLGMGGSHFVDTDGEDAAGHVTTARDLALATAALFGSPPLEDLVDRQTMTVQVRGPHARTLTLVNTNQLLGAPGVHGVKTGTTDAAGQCLVTAVWRGDDRVVTVVLGSADRYGDTRALLNDLDSRFRWIQLGRGGDVGDLTARLQAQGLVMVTGRTVLLTVQQASTLRYELTTRPPAAAAPWNPAGEVVFFAGNAELLRLPVYPRTTTPVP